MPATTSKERTGRTVRVYRHGGPDTLKCDVDVPDPAVGLDAVLIRSVATGVNPMDWKVRSGTRQKHFPLTMPAIPGKDVSGVGGVLGSACRAAVHTARKRGTTIIVGVRARQSAEVESLGAPDGVANTAAGGEVAGVLSPRR